MAILPQTKLISLPPDTKRERTKRRLRKPQARRRGNKNANGVRKHTGPLSVEMWHHRIRLSLGTTCPRYIARVSIQYMQVLQSTLASACKFDRMKVSCVGDTIEIREGLVQRTYFRHVYHIAPFPPWPRMAAMGLTTAPLP